MNSRLLGTVALAAVATLSLASCSASATPDAAPTENYAKDGTFATVITQDPGNLHPLTTNIVATKIVDAYAYDSLLFLEPKTGKVKPYLAKSWTDGANKVTYTLNKGITCSDGTPFTAQTAADNINWVVDEANGSPLRGSVYPATAVATAEGDVLTVETPKPSAFLLKVIGTSLLACSSAMDDPESVASASSGTGLFVIKEVVPNDHITLERRAGYNWGPDGITTSDSLGVPKTVTIKIVTDATTVTNMLLSKEINAAVISKDDEERAISAKLAHRSYTTMVDELIFNSHKDLPTADPAVRKAFVQAVDLDLYTKISTAGKGERARSLAVAEPHYCNYDSVKGSYVDFDISAAKSTLAAAGWKKGSDGTLEKDGKKLDIIMIYEISDTKTAAAEYLAKQWKEIGANIIMKGGDVPFLISHTLAGTNPTSWTLGPAGNLQSHTPNIFVPYLTGAPREDGGTNFAHIDNPEYAQHAAQANLLSGAEGCAEWEKAEKALYTQNNVLPIATMPSNIYYNGAVSLLDSRSGIVSGAAVRVLK